MPRRPTPTPREFRRLEDAASPELAAGVREVEWRRAEVERDRRKRAAIHRCPRCRWEGRWEAHAMNPHFGYAICPACWRQSYDILTVELPPPDSTEADLARAWTAADPPAEPGEEPPC